MEELYEQSKRQAYDQIADIFSTIDEAKREREHLNENLLANQLNEKDALLRCGKLEEAIEQNRQRFADLNNYYQSLEQEVHSLERAEKQEARDHVRNLEQSGLAHQDDLEKIQKEMDNRAQIGVREFENLQRDHQELIENAESEKKHLEALQAELKSDLNDVNGDLKGVRDQNAAVSSDINRIKTELDKAISERDDLIKKATHELARQNNKLSAELSSKNSRAKELKKSGTHYLEKMVTAERNQIQCKKEKDILQAEQIELEGALSKIQGATLNLDQALGEDTREYNTVLVVDDEPDIRELISEDLEDFYTVYQAEDGAHALEVIKAHPEISVVCTDQKMPKMLGIDMGLEAQKIDEFLYVILLTAFSDFDVCKNAMNKGAIHTYLNKPVDFEELKDAIGQGFAHNKKKRHAKNLVESAQHIVLSKVESLTSALQQLETLDKELTKTHTQLTQTAETQKKTLSESDGKLEKLSTENTALTAQTQGLRVSSAVLEKSTNALDAVVTKLQASLEAATSKRDKLVSDFSDSSSVFKKYDEELKKLKGTAVKKTTALKKLQATTEQSHTTLGQAQAALQEVQDKYNHAKQASADLEKNLTDAIAETQGQPQKVIDMTQALEAVKITHSELEAKFEEMSAIYENMGGDLDALGGGADPALQAKLTELETENTTQTGTIAQLKTTLEQVWTRNKELEA